MRLRVVVCVYLHYDIAARRDCAHPGGFQWQIAGSNSYVGSRRRLQHTGQGEQFYPTLVLFLVFRILVSSFINIRTRTGWLDSAALGVVQEQRIDGENALGDGGRHHHQEKRK